MNMPEKPEYVVTVTGEGEYARKRANVGATVQKYFDLWRAAEADRKLAVSNEISSRTELDNARAAHANTIAHHEATLRDKSEVIANYKRNEAITRDSRYRERAVLSAAYSTHLEIIGEWWFRFLPRYYRDAIHAHRIQANEVL